MVGTRLDKYSEYAHRDTLLAEYGIKIGEEKYLVMIPISASTPTISSTTTTTANWIPIATDLSTVIKWRITELSGNDFWYAYVAAPGDNFDVGFGWVEDNTSPSGIYIKRPTDKNITIKLTLWRA